MSVLGNLNDYVKFQMAESMTQPGGGGGSMAALPAQMAMGFGMAQEMMKGFAQPGAAQPGAVPPVPGAPVPGAPAAPAADNQTPAQVAQVLAVSEEDVLATLESGDLKGKKIGSTWRITRAALDAFLSA